MTRVILTELDNDSRRGRSHEPISVLVHCSPSARQSRPINGILLSSYSREKNADEEDPIGCNSSTTMSKTRQ